MADPWSSSVPQTNNAWGPPRIPLASPPAPPTVLPRKAQRHRKRHVPVGPAGIWFQNFPQTTGTTGGGGNSTSNNTSSSTNRPSMDNDGNVNAGEEEEEDQQDILQNLSRSGALQRRSGRHTHELISFSSPAWIAMQCDCGWVTPSLPAHYNVAERYQALRPHVPAQYSMLYDLLQKAYSLQHNHTTQTGATTEPWFCEQCVVLVSNIHGGTTANGWTVTLTDETGETLTGWLQPESVRKQLQQQPSSSNSSGSSSTASNSGSNQDTGESPPHHGSWFRTGCVWRLRNTTLFLSPESSDTETLSYLLLIGEDNIKDFWTPGDGASLSDKRYIEWLEQRNRVAVHDDDDDDDGGGGDEEDQDEVNQGLVGQRRIDPTGGMAEPRQRGQHQFRALPLAVQQEYRRDSSPPLDSVTNQSSEPRTTYRHTPMSETIQPVRKSLSPVSFQLAPSNSPVRPHEEGPRPPNPYNRLGNGNQQSCTSHFTSGCAALPPLALPSPLPEQHSTGMQNQTSPFASFACTETESTLSQLMDSSKRQSISHSPRPNNDNWNTRSSTSLVVRTTPPGGPSNRKQPEQPKPAISEVATNTPPASQSVKVTARTTASSRKDRGSSSRKRKKKADQSKLWTNADDFDFSDESDDEIQPRERRILHKTEPKESTPSVKKSLFHTAKLDEFASILSSDDDDDE